MLPNRVLPLRFLISQPKTYIFWYHHTQQLILFLVASQTTLAAQSLSKQGQGPVGQPSCHHHRRPSPLASVSHQPQPHVFNSLFLDISSFQFIKETVMSCLINAKGAFSRSDTKQGRTPEPSLLRQGFRYLSSCKFSSEKLVHKQRSKRF